MTWSAANSRLPGPSEAPSRQAFASVRTPPFQSTTERA